MELVEKNSINIGHLKEQINLIQESVHFNLTLFWSVLAVIIAGLSVSLVIMVRKWVEKRVEKEVIEFKKELRMFENQWYNPTLLNGWHSDGFETLMFTKDYLGNVHIKGAIKLGLTPHSFSLPKGYRPSQITTFGVIGEFENNHTAGNLTVMPSGEVLLNINISYTSYLNGISFIADDKNQ